MAKICLECGSCHNGDYKTAEEMVKAASNAGADGCKFQMFPEIPKYTDCGNIPLPYEWMPKLVDFGITCGIEVYASVFDWEAFLVCHKARCRSIKFAYSMRDSDMVKVAHIAFQNVHVSCDVFTATPPKALRYFVVPNQYPVLHKIDFDPLFPLFDGYSHHGLGIGQAVEAYNAGAKYIECHFRVGPSKCPDAAFALTVSEVQGLVRRVKE